VIGSALGARAYAVAEAGAAGAGEAVEVEAEALGRVAAVGLDELDLV
jgi:hypothetical protein